jgi:glycosyltransferase involved in cell wall biosynthesis
MSVNDVKYVIISPVRDEEKFIEFTLRSVIAQTIRPIEWVIIDDGSTDNTAGLVQKYAKEHQWIRLLQRGNRGYRKAGDGVIEAFNHGYDFLRSMGWDYLVKLDGDLTFDTQYFEKCFEHFIRDEKLGVGGGVIFNIKNGRLARENHPQFHVRGATKIYRRACWTAIGGLLKAPGWDTLDEVKANMLGWQTRSFTDLRIIHHRSTGSADGMWKNLVKNGRANYIAGYHPLFMLLKGVKRLFEKPYLVGSLGLLYGFMSGYTKRISQVDDDKLIRYIRKQQMNRLMFRESIWK